MITRDQIPSVLDHPVYASDGRKIGEAKHVFVDDTTGEPEWVTVKTGMFGSHESFVPVRDARTVEDHLEVPYSRDKIKGAPHVDIDSGGHLSEDEEHRLYDHYGIDWDAHWRKANQPGEGGWAARERGGAGGTGAAAGAGAAGAAGAAAGRGRHRRGEPEERTAPGTAGADEKRGRGDMRGRDDMRGREGARGGMAGEGEKQQHGERARRGSDDDFMTRSEEHLDVHTERRETGHARLRKYVVTEEEQISVPVRKEQVRLDREPITEANKGQAVSGPEITEAEYEVTLHEDRPVVETRVQPVERVRLRVEETTENQTVRGRVRKERIDAESDTIDEQGRTRGKPKP
ncbi:PRC and DUF2382 domain-containing protein [Streptomyces sp. GSL17-111]|uniref:PRC and DUF2382 domain-containing protein n=1 Tax=Streptomyces sp. GSL17-111 TaxID=3121596 RepID=UPI0030F3734B